MMAKRFKSLSILLVLFLIQFGFPAGLLAQDKEMEAHIAGKLYHFNGTTSVEDVPVRIVHLESGEEHEEETGKDGCYSFKDLKAGSYTISVDFEDKKYTFDQKVTVDRLKDQPVVVAACLGLREDLKLNLLDDCHVCLKSFPLAWLILPAGAVVGGIIIEDDPEGSVVNP